MGGNIRPYTGKISSRLINIFLMDADGQIPFLIDAVAGPAYFGKQHIIVLFPVLVEAILFHRKQERASKLIFVDPAVIKRNLRSGAGIQRI